MTLVNCHDLLLNVTAKKRTSICPNDVKSLCQGGFIMRTVVDLSGLQTRQGFSWTKGLNRESVSRTLIIWASLVLIIFAYPRQSLAQGDTLTVYAGGTNKLTLDQIIGNDTTAGGFQKHKVYKLVSLDTTYIFDAPINLRSSVTIMGVPDPATGRPPCIQPDVLIDWSVPPDLFHILGSGAHVTVKNLYLLGSALDGSQNGGGVAIRVFADSVRLVCDHDVFEEWLGYAIGYDGNWDSFFLTNCDFRNANHPLSQYVGEVIRNEPGNVFTDSLVMRDNTIFCINAYAACPVTKYYETYFEFSHNDVIYTFKNPFFIFNVTNAKIDNNIFYGAWAGGINFQEYPWWDQLWTPAKGSIIDMDRLDSMNAAVFDPADVGKSAPVLDSLAEMRRTVQVDNNDCFWPAKLTTFWHDWDDTAHFNASGDSIITPTWMNNRTTHMFTDKTQWPGFVAKNNQFVDPGFGSEILNVLDNTGGGMGVGFFKYFREIRTGTAATDVWGYKLTQVNGNKINWVPPWPLPETQLLRYTNTALENSSSDGLPLGDPNWFAAAPPKQSPVVSRPDVMLGNNYPNPFNPTTVIRFEVPSSGFVSLKVYDVLGRLVKTLVDNIESTGYHEVVFSGAGLASGVYFYTLRQGASVITKKMLLLK